MQNPEVMQSIEMLRQLNQAIQDDLNRGDLESASAKINEYAGYIEDPNLYSLKANYLFMAGRLEEAKDVLTKGLNKFPFHFDLNLNYGVVCSALGDYWDCLRYCVYAIKYADRAEQTQEAQNVFDQYSLQLLQEAGENFEAVKQEIEACALLLAEGDDRWFPLDRFNQSRVRHVIAEGTSEEALINLNGSLLINNLDKNNYFNFKTEMFKGRRAAERIIELQEDSIVPFSLIEEGTGVSFQLNGQSFPFRAGELRINQYHYLRFSEAGSLKVTADRPVFIGNPIPLKDEPKRERLVVHIFIDGLSYDFLEQQGLERVMPNTHRFFQKGLIATNCHATSEWTLPSIASITTGKYTTNHRLYHPTYNYSFENHNRLLQECYKDGGYFTAYIGNNWRITPTYGYYKGYDRILYKNFLGGMDCREVVMDTIEHLETFKDKNNYVWMCIEDLHHVPDQIECNLSTQAKTDISLRMNSHKKGTTTVLTKFDESKIQKYELEITRIDTYLGMLYDYLTQKYEEDELVLVLHSDHGQSFLAEEDYVLHPSRSRIPLMMKGRGIPSGKTTEWLEAIDIFPAMLQLSGLEQVSGIDGKLPAVLGGRAERNYVFSESLHPGQSYKASITDNTHSFRFETKNSVRKDGLVRLDSYSVSLLNRETGEDEAYKNVEKASYYEKLVYDHIRHFMITDPICEADGTSQKRS
ncbi:hypothetical protein D3P08_25155 [Paenibacillus nanensis]|uniref:Sulfatase N-terminal domain-containing protein n=1 Tax=Paenibacillus nanensis TaxID=393251 RepID=A0A3A1UJK2_9BACL|nr:sulfatase-like hydrolase/transferase [Paenibacillus nanensis]RIX47313.1 hypothetical protein D3P08_25155 [Paenibacillus nanensis]